ncbi:hypothetical protein [Acinetobacter pittii]|uniref:hypothetical protein n=1 Tax=Acinetobacter pittii TaxID=48296 RepID=UPI00325FF888
MRDRFYIACFRDNVGPNVSFHRHQFAGYHTDIDQAYVCTFDEAQRHFNQAREFERPISADHVDALAVWKVDHQTLPNSTQIIDGVFGYAVFVQGKYSGNDVYWLNKGTYDIATDFEKASYFSKDEVNQLGGKYVAIPFSLAEKAKRRTFNFEQYNPRIMTQGAGLKMPEHLKRAKRKVKNPQTRFNCPSCGKIVWQYNPYDFDHCDHCGKVGE